MILRVTILFALIVLPSIAYADITTGLVGYWNLNEGTGTAANDTSGSGNNGTLNNGPTWTAGISGTGLGFNYLNAQYVSVGTGANPTTNDFTVAFWERSTVNNFWSFMSNRQSNSANTGFLITEYYASATGTLRFQLNNASTNWDSETSGYTGSKNVSDGNWHHVVLSVSRSTNIANVYVDGVVDTGLSNINIAAVTGSLSSTAPINIARDAAYCGTSSQKCSFTGTIDEVRIYSRALTTTDVVQLYTLNSLSNGLIGWWSFDEGSGTTVYDPIGGNNGTFVNSPTFVSGISGKALSFNGGNHVQSSAASLNFANTTFSVSFWEKESVSNGNFIMANAAVSGGWGFRGDGVVFIKNVLNGQSQYSANANTTTLMANGSWHHIVYIITTNTTTPASQAVTMYIDGTLDAGTFNYSTYFSPSTDLTFGCRNSGANQWTGSLDDVRFYNRALSTTEITALYNQGNTATATGVGTVTGVGSVKM